MRRTIKSFVLRAGRMSHRQQHGFDVLLKNYVLPLQNQPWDFFDIFANRAEVIVEIGFGMGASLLEMAKSKPDTNFIGIEVHVAGVGSLAADLHDNDVKNVRIVNFDAVEVFKNYIPAESLAGIQIFFPDPWHKKKHNKRRLIQPDFIKLIVATLSEGGFIHCATDWEDYAVHMLTVLSSDKTILNCDAKEQYIDRPETRPITKFEQRGTKLGHGVWDLKFKKI